MSTSVMPLMARAEAEVHGGLGSPVLKSAATSGGLAQGRRGIEGMSDQLLSLLRWLAKQTNAAWPVPHLDGEIL